MESLQIINNSLDFYEKLEILSSKYSANEISCDELWKLINLLILKYQIPIILLLNSQHFLIQQLIEQNAANSNIKEQPQTLKDFFQNSFSFFEPLIQKCGNIKITEIDNLLKTYQQYISNEIKYMPLSQVTAFTHWHQQLLLEYYQCKAVYKKKDSARLKIVYEQLTNIMQCCSYQNFSELEIECAGSLLQRIYHLAQKIIKLSPELCQQKQVNQPNYKEEMKQNLVEIKDIGQRTFFVKNEKLRFLESINLEYKQYYFPLQSKLQWKLKETINGMVNSQGGQILIGINDAENMVIGVPLTTKQQDQFILMIEFLIKDFHPRTLPEQVSIAFFPIKESSSQLIIPQLWIVKILVQQGIPRELYTYGNMIAFERRNAGNRLIRCPHEIKEEIQRRCKLPEAFPLIQKDPPPEEVNTYAPPIQREEAKLNVNKQMLNVNDSVKVRVAFINYKSEYIIFNILGTKQKGIIYFDKLKNARNERNNDIAGMFRPNEQMKAIIQEVSNNPNFYFPLRIEMFELYVSQKEQLYLQKGQQQGIVTGTIIDKTNAQNEQGFFIKFQNQNIIGFLPLDGIKENQIFENDADLENQMKIGQQIMVRLQEVKNGDQYIFQLVGF